MSTNYYIALPHPDKQGRTLIPLCTQYYGGIERGMQYQWIIDTDVVGVIRGKTVVVDDEGREMTMKELRKRVRATEGKGSSA
jgi:hypothetical protein